MGALLAGLLFNYTIHRSAALRGSPAPAAVAVISLLLWISPIAAGIFTAFL
jgi:hypothetical protein